MLFCNGDRKARGAPWNWRQRRFSEYTNVQKFSITGHKSDINYLCQGASLASSLHSAQPPGKGSVLQPLPRPGCPPVQPVLLLTRRRRRRGVPRQRRPRGAVACRGTGGVQRAGARSARVRRTTASCRGCAYRSKFTRVATAAVTAAARANSWQTASMRFRYAWVQLTLHRCTDNGSFLPAASPQC